MKTGTKKTILLLFAGCFIGVFMLGGIFEVVHATSNDEFCANCHSNHPLAAERGKSIHGNNRAGITVTCSDCHIAKGVGHVLSRKAAAMTDMLTFIVTDDFNTQEWLDAHRQEQAGAALEYISSVSSETCKSCHETIESELPQAMSPLAQRVHKFNNEGDQFQCIYCHRGVAHNYDKGWFVSQSKQIL